MTRLAFVFVLFVLIASTAATVADDTSCIAPTAQAGEKTNVLFMVGGADFHDPVNLPPIVKKVLEDTGKFSVTITQDLDQFKPENIKAYGMVMIYTTGRELTKEQEQGLLGLVENGGALVGIHSVTDSFKNSDAYWKLVGGRFTGHGSGTFKVKITGKSHSIVKGITDFEITDETYRDKFHPDSKTIVLMRREMDGEPASWIQYVGKGRVFVTGLGHGKPAWQNPAFQQMILQASLWATGRLNP